MSSIEDEVSITAYVADDAPQESIDAVTAMIQGMDGVESVGFTTKEQALEAFLKHDRIRVVRIADGFLGNASMFKYARDLGNPRGDMYEIGLWEESIVEYGDQIMFAIYIPQEAVTIPETLDGVRAALEMQDTMEEATRKTNEYLGMAKWK